MSKSFVIQLEVTADSDDRALKDLEGVLGKLNAKHADASSAASTHSKALGGLGSAVDNIKNKLLGWVTSLGGMAAAWKIATDSIRAFTESQTSFVALDKAIRAFDTTGRANAETVRAWADELQKLVIIAGEDLEGAVSGLLPVTNDTEASMRLVEVAAKAARANIGSLQSNIDALTRAMLGVASRGLDPFSVLLRKAQADGTDFAAVLVQIESAVGKVTDQTLTYAQQMALMKLEADEAREALGEQIVTVLTALSPVLKVVAGGVALVAAGFMRLAAEVRAAVSEVGASLKFWSDVVKVGPTAAADTFLAAWAKARDGVATSTAAIEKMLEGVWKAFEPPVDSGAGGTKAAAAVQARLKAISDAMKAAREREKGGGLGGDAYEQWLKTLSKAEQELERRRIATFNRQNSLRDREIAQQVAIAALAQQLRDAADSDERAKAIATFERQNAERDAVIELETLKRQEARATAEMAAANAEAARIANLNAAASISGSLTVLFGENKAAALAQAVISAYATAAGAARDTPGPVWVRIAAYVAALAQVWQAVEGISRTEMGSAGAGAGGGGGGGGGMRIYAGGAGGDRGSTGERPGGTTSITTTQNTGNTYVVNTLTASQAAQSMKELERARPKGSAAMQRQSTVAQHTQIGSRRYR